MSARDWDAASYDRISGPLEELGRLVLDRLALRGDETVLDAGCGTGRVTRALLERLPRGRVIAVDASPAMIAVARAALPPEVDVRRADLLELELDEPVDAILSTATFHWVLDHDRLFARLFAALAPGGWLAAQCGGEGNVANIHGAAAAVCAREPFAPHFEGWTGPWRFATPAQTRASLAAAGFDSIEAWLERVDVVPEEPVEFLRTMTLGPHRYRLPPELRDPFVDAVFERLPAPLTIEYVRLNIDARRPPTG